MSRFATEIPEAALAVGAHPDDVELFAGGVLSVWAERGCRIAIVVLTDGRLGSHDPAVPPNAVATQRAAETRVAAAALNATVVGGSVFDGALQAHRDAAAQTVASAIREHRPDVVLAHDPWRLYEPHPDHRAAGFASCDGVIAAREHHAVESPLPPHRPSEVWLAGSDHPNHFAPLERIEPKLELLALHASQFREEGWQGKVRMWNERIGAERGYRFAEAFRVLALASAPA